MQTTLTIAGSDSSGGAGIQADLKTFLANGVYGMSVITALTAQNTVGVRSTQVTTPTVLADQLDAVFTDIFPDAVKIGMIGNRAAIAIVAEKLATYQPEYIVLDPVMVATSGSELFDVRNLDALLTQLFPLAEVVTPNIAEAEMILGTKITSPEDMEAAAMQIFNTYGCATLVKGGHLTSDASDVLVTAQGMQWFHSPRIDNPNTHGTGCTLSSAIASQLALGHDLITSVRLAKNYLTGAIAYQLDLGQGSGPMHHGYQLKMTETDQK